MKYIASLFLVIALCLGAYVFLQPERISAEFGDLHTCRIAPEPESRSCIRKIVTDLLKTSDARTIMSKADAEFSAGECHVIGHVVGQELHANSMETALAMCGSACAFACLHAATQGLFEHSPAILSLLTEKSTDTKPLIAQGRALCATSPACHGIGHAFQLAAGTLREALPLCRAMGLGEDLTGSCYTGVFMESFGFSTSSPLDREIISPRKDPTVLLNPCQTVEPQYRNTCYRFLYIKQNDTFVAHGITDFTEKTALRIAACETLSSLSERGACAESVGVSFYHFDNTSHEQVRMSCETMQRESDRSECLGSYAMEVAVYGHPDTALGFCTQVGSLDRKRICYSRTFWPIKGLAVSNFDTACAGVSDPDCELVRSTYKNDLPLFSR